MSEQTQPADTKPPKKSLTPDLSDYTQFHANTFYLTTLGTAIATLQATQAAMMQAAQNMGGGE